MSEPGEIYDGFTCRAHGLRHGPGGCPRCRDEEQSALREEARRVRKLAVLAVVGFVSATVTYLAWPRHPPDVRLDPQEYRPAIETLESVLYGSYGTARPEAEDRETLSQSARALEFALTTAKGSDSQRRALAAVVPYTTRVSDLAAGRETLDMPALREEWEKLRAAHFKPAPWLRTTSAIQLEHSAEGRGVPADAAQYKKSLDSLRQVASRVDAVLGRLPPASGRDPDPAILKEWGSVRDEVRQSLERAKQEFPAEPTDRHWTWKQAYRDLGLLGATLSAAMQDDARQPARMPAAEEGRLRWAEVQRALDVAQRSLDAAIR